MCFRKGNMDRRRGGVKARLTIVNWARVGCPGELSEEVGDE